MEKSEIAAAVWETVRKFEKCVIGEQVGLAAGGEMAAVMVRRRSEIMDESRATNGFFSIFVCLCQKCVLRAMIGG